MTTGSTAERVRTLRDLTGFGIMDCKLAFERAESFGGDVVAALAAIHRNGIAVAMKGDRAAWAAAGACEQAARWRETVAGLAEAFPPPTDAQPAPRP